MELSTSNTETSLANKQELGSSTPSGTKMIKQYLPCSRGKRCPNCIRRLIFYGTVKYDSEMIWVGNEPLISLSLTLTDKIRIWENTKNAKSIYIDSGCSSIK